MTVYERLRDRLSAVGIYGGDAQVLDRELEAYSAEIELLYAGLSEMFRERFIATAQDEGLCEYERLFGPERTDESVENRREMLSLRMNLGEGDFTPAGIRRALDSFGFEYTLSEYPQIGRLDVNAESGYPAAQQAWIRSETAKIMPAHIEFRLTFNTMTWTQLDALNRIFAAIDAENLTWQQIDNRTV